MPQMTRDDYLLLVNNLFPTNAQGEITAARLREILTDTVNSVVLWYNEKIEFDNLDPALIGTGPNTIAAGDDPRFNTTASVACVPNLGALLAFTANVNIYGILINGYTNSGDNGGGLYIRLPAPPVPIKSWHKQTLDGAWFQLAASPVNPKQLGAIGDNLTDDSAACQNWLDYINTFGVKGITVPGTYVIPINTLNVESNVVIEGKPDAIFKRTAEVSAGPLFLASSKNNVLIDGIACNASTGWTSTSTESIGTGAKTFVVPAGMNYQAGDTLQIQPSADVRNYMLATVTSYVGTSLVVNVYLASGSGTFNNWVGVWASGNFSAIRLVSCNNSRVLNTRISGKFYIGIESLNSNSTIIEANEIVGLVNRAIYIYGASGANVNNSAINNFIRGGGYTEYAINCNGSIAGSITNVIITGNHIEGMVAQGVAIAGSTTNAVVADNTFKDFAGNAAAVLVSEANGTQVQDVSVTGNVFINVSTSIMIIDALFVTVTGNKCTGGIRGILVIRVSYTCLYVNITGNIIKSAALIGISFEVGGSILAASCGQSNCSSNNILGIGTSIGISMDVNTDRITYPGNFSLSNGGGNIIAAGTNLTTGNITA